MSRDFTPDDYARIYMEDHERIMKASLLRGAIITCAHKVDHTLTETTCDGCCKYWVTDQERAVAIERNRIIARIEKQICFDALADAEGRCSNHGGKCYELRELIKSLQATDFTGSALPIAQEGENK
jgi:hypothetical protein